MMVNEGSVNVRITAYVSIVAMSISCAPRARDHDALLAIGYTYRLGIRCSESAHGQDRSIDICVTVENTSSQTVTCAFGYSLAIKLLCDKRTMHYGQHTMHVSGDPKSPFIHEIKPGFGIAKCMSVDAAADEWKEAGELLSCEADAVVHDVQSKQNVRLHAVANACKTESK